MKNVFSRLKYGVFINEEIVALCTTLAYAQTFAASISTTCTVRRLKTPGKLLYASKTMIEQLHKLRIILCGAE